jgi:hypothetical protein
LTNDIPDTRGLWKRTDALSERVKFILEWERRWQASQGRLDVAELSRLYGVSRQTAHVWIKRYQAAGHDLRVMHDRSRRPCGLGSSNAIRSSAFPA